MPDEWHQVDRGWWLNSRGDAVRNSRTSPNAYNFKGAGWWLMPASKPDHPDFDIGPFRSCEEAKEAADAK
jgi:hypothetical protein